MFVYVYVCSLSLSHQARTVVARQIFLADLHQTPKGILKQKKQKQNSCLEQLKKTTTTTTTKKTTLVRGETLCRPFKEKLKKENKMLRRKHNLI